MVSTIRRGVLIMCWPGEVMPQIFATVFAFLFVSAGNVSLIVFVFSKTTTGIAGVKQDYSISTYKMPMCYVL